MVEYLNTSKKVVVGLVVNDIFEKNQLAFCLSAKRVSVCGKPLFMCSLGFGVCRSSGERVKFRCFSQGYRVTWVCDRLDLER
jgi:hypothetical protein